MNIFNRAGAFQFIDATSSDQLPLPYQIQIISREGGRICWRYPQPRAMHFIQIFPVPMHSPHLTAADHKSIKCQLEYYSEAMNAFRPYCDFFLSEKHIQVLPLPALQCTSEIWRIVVHQSYVSVTGAHFQEDDDDDDDGSDDSDDNNVQHIDSYLNSDSHLPPNTILNPKALVGCMRVDSYFSPKLVSDFQVAVNVAHLSFSLRNSFPDQMYRMPEPFQHYAKTSSDRDLHAFFRLYLRNTKSYANLYADGRIFGSVETMLNSSILDFSYLTMQPFVEDVQCNISLDVKEAGIDVSAVADVIRIRYGQSVGHTLLVSEQLWRQMLCTDKMTAQTDNRAILATRFIVNNCTADVIRFGQHGTQEHLFIQTNESLFYSFRSPLFGQKLSFTSVIASEWTSEAATVGREGTQMIALSDNRFLFVKVDKLSATQRSITVKGQIEFLNMSSDSLQVQYMRRCSQTVTEPNQCVEFLVQAGHSLSVVSRSDTGDAQCFR